MNLPRPLVLALALLTFSIVGLVFGANTPPCDRASALAPATAFTQADTSFTADTVSSFSLAKTTAAARSPGDARILADYSHKNISANGAMIEWSCLPPTTREVAALPADRRAAHRPRLCIQARRGLAALHHPLRRRKSRAYGQRSVSRDGGAQLRRRANLNGEQSGRCSP